MKKFLTRCFYILWLIISGAGDISGQGSARSFELNGKVNIDSGRAILMPVNDSVYYPNYKGKYEADIRNGRFHITGPISYPTAFSLLVKKGSKAIYISGMFIVDPGSQNLYCNIHAPREVPKIDNESAEKLIDYRSKFKGIEAKVADMGTQFYTLEKKYKNKIPAEYRLAYFNQKDSLSRQSDSIFLAYAKRHTNSYLTLWKVVQRLLDGYTAVSDSAYQYLAAGIKNTGTGKTIARKLASSRVIGYGKKFPSLRLLNLNDEPVVMKTAIPGNKFMLVDFWFSHCPPCIDQFTRLKAIYSAYHSKGFNIIGISTDKKENISNWKAVIKEHELPWPQYLDINARNAKIFSIGLYPSNFLVDHEGKIIARNIQPVQLNHFLMLHLK